MAILEDSFPVGIIGALEDTYFYIDLIKPICRKLFQRTLTASAPGSTDSDAEEEVRKKQGNVKICESKENKQM